MFLEKCAYIWIFHNIPGDNAGSMASDTKTDSVATNCSPEGDFGVSSGDVPATVSFGQHLTSVIILFVEIVIRFDQENQSHKGLDS